ncbi:MAG TPA: hypothetical protein VFA07_00405 [Chthonomonadaceae bacterium]|nr:hypothetical protein [Chthonomonadaceae bacterium]
MAGGIPGGPVGYGYPTGMPARKSSSGCLIWGLVGCGALVILLVLFMIFAAYRFSKNSGFQRMMSNAMSAPQCAQRLVYVREALDSYRKDHKGAYPASLSALVPHYLNDDSYLSCQGGETSAFVYTPPKSDSPADTPVASYSFGESQFMATTRGQVSQTTIVRLLKDGRVVSDQINRTTFYQAGEGGRTRGRGSADNENQ